MPLACVKILAKERVIRKRARIGDSSAGKHFVVRADEKLTAFLELQRAIHEFAVDLIS